MERILTREENGKFKREIKKDKGRKKQSCEKKSKIKSAVE